MDHTLGSVLEQLFVLALLILLALAFIGLLVRHQGPPRPDQYAVFFAVAVLAALIFSVPAVAFVAVTALLALAFARLMARYSLLRLSYRRTLTPSRLFPGDEADLVTRLQNDKPLPLTWITVQDPIVLGMLRSHRDMDDLLQFFHRLTKEGRRQRIFNLEWKCANTDSGGEISRGRNRSGDACKTDFGDATRAGKSLLTLMVDDLEIHVTDLKQKGLETSAIETVPGLYRKAEITDPDGNRVQIGQPG